MNTRALAERIFEAVLDSNSVNRENLVQLIQEVLDEEMVRVPAISPPWPRGIEET